MINVKLKTRENIDVQLQPKQGIKIDSSNKYLFDPTLIQGYVDLTKDYSDKAMQSEANAKASEMNAELSAEQAKASEDNAKLSETRAKESELNAKTSENNAKESETNAKTSETNAKNSEVKATQEANASAESAYQSQQSALASAEYASNAQSDSENASETLTHVLESEEKTREYSETAKENSEIAVAKANESKQSEINAKASENKAIQEANASAESAYNSQQSALASYEYSQNAESDAQNASETLTHVLESEAKVNQSEQNVLASEHNAKLSEANAKASETRAIQEANASAESAYQSQQSALASHEYASNAEADAQNVSESLDKVLESLDTVLASEANAKSSEQIATQKATESLNNANIATTKSQEALQSANIAKEKADEASQFALECQDIKQSLGTVYTYRGAVASVPDLPTNAKVGDVYDVQDSGTNYAWNGDRWDSLGASIDLSLYATKEYVNTTEQEIIENYMEADTALQTQITSLSTVVDEEQEKIIGIESKIPTSASSSNLLVTNTDMFNATQDVRSDFAEADSELQTQINGQATVIASKQDKLVSGTNIKTVNGESVLGSGDILIKSAPDLDNKTITQNASSQLQAIGVIDQRTSSAVKTWTGTKAQYDALSTKDSNTLYNITDDESSIVNTVNDLINSTKNQFNSLLDSLYPVNSVYLSTSSTCPLASLISGSKWEQMGTSLITSVNTSVPIKGNGKSFVLTNGTNSCTMSVYNYLQATTQSNSVNIGTSVTRIGNISTNNAWGFSTDSNKSGIIGTVTRTSISVYIFKRTA